MKRVKLLAGLLLTLTLVIGMSVMAFAYDYTVTISSGPEGDFGSGDVITEVHKYKDKDKVDLGLTGPYAAQLTVPENSPYYLKGFVVTGQDPDSRVGTVTVDKDMDFIAVYGIKGEMVKYTVSYLDENGAQLLPGKTLYGNVGDKPVVAYQHVENYQPQANNLTKTLVADETKNVFEFRYTPTPAGETIVIDEGGAGGAGGAGAAGAGAGAAGAAGGAGAGAGAGAAIDDNATPEAGPADIIDLDDNDTPQAGPGGDGQTDKDGKEHKGSALPWIIGGAAAVVVAGAIVGIVLGTKKKKKNK